jgi:bacteriochlorophyll 4-vinyl reductase
VSREQGEASGYYYPNVIAKIYLEAIEEVMGANGMKALLNMVGMQHLIDNFPPDNLDKEFDFADFARLNEATEMMYGPRGGRALSLRAGRKAFAQGLGKLEVMAGVGDKTFRFLPLNIRLKVALRAMANAFTSTSDQLTYVQEEPDHFLYVIERCPVCWGRHSDGPLCHAALGIVQEGLSWGTGGRNFRVIETTCIAQGDPSCNFVIYKEPLE